MKPILKRIKIIDAPFVDGSSEKIAKHLLEVLKRIRSSKYLIETNIGVEDTKEQIVNDLSVNHSDTRRIERRAKRLYAARLVAGGLSHLKTQEIERLEPSLGGMHVVMPKDSDWADEIAATLHEEMPWMGRATEYAWRALRRSAQRGEPILIRPVILNGPPGIGKSVWSRALAAALEVPFADIDATKGVAGLSLVGVERGWSSAQAGRPLDVMLAKVLGNPLIVVDEICKVRSIQSTGGSIYSFGDALLSLLEPATAKTWDCPYFRVRFDMSHISWVLTSNTISSVSETVRSRCQIIEIPDVTNEQLQDFALKKGLKLGLSEAAVGAVVATIVQAPNVTGRRLSLRDAVRMLERAEMLERRPRLH